MRNYRTKHQGLVAYMLSLDYSVDELELTDGQCWFTMNCSVESGKNVADDYFEDRVRVTPFDYYKRLQEVRQHVWERKNGKSNG